MTDLSNEELLRYGRHLVLSEVGVAGQTKLTKKDAAKLINLVFSNENMNALQITDHYIDYFVYWNFIGRIIV